ncbi:MAG TPA: hypothetical protein VFS13_14200 [Steroidobacteraceae bacterium]|jgi:hypothetical protein|nr:hypothetical protein [Steroidobacteraceae bacterium]
MTDVSSNPLVGSVIYALIDHGVDVCAKPAGVDPGCARGCIRNGPPWHEAVGPKWPQLRDGSAIACDDDRSARFHLA